MPSDFVHIHVHTEYSLLDGQSTIDDLMARANELEQEAMAITDHGVMFGAIDFFRAAKAANVKPIIGMEAYLAPRTMFDRDSDLDRKPYHMLLLAQNLEGYRNLCKLASEAQLNGYYYRPRIDAALLREHSAGLIATTGCLASQIPSLILQQREDEAEQKLKWFHETFGPERFFLELQNHDIEDLDRFNKWLIGYRQRNPGQLRLVATNDVHYVRKEDADNHDTLLCIQTGSQKKEDARKRMTLSPFGSYYLKSSAEMWADFSERGGKYGGLDESFIRESFESTLQIADMTDLDLNSKGYHLPKFPLPQGWTENAYMRHLCKMGLSWRFPGNENDPKLQERLEFELAVIDRMGFNTYFLIVWDLCEFARSADIWWNVRGSGAGSLVAYCLGITSIDPLQNSLLFERFLNPGRITMPDIDLDYPDNQRGQMIAYAVEKYGDDKVAAIITFGTMGAKASVKDVGRALGIDIGKINRAAGMIPQEAKQKKIREYIDANSELQQLYKDDPEMRSVLDTAMALQGMTRHASMHAAGVIISDAPLVDYLPLHRITGNTDASQGVLKSVTQYPMETAESIGLLKVDFLGLSTLTILRKACELIERHRYITYTMENIPYRHDNKHVTDDERKMLDETFVMLGRGETVGVFQLESGGMQQMLRGMRPFKFEHIIAGISLYRPGPMDFIPQFNRRMHNEETFEYLHPKLVPILQETYGIITYQEQLMQIASDLFGYNLGEADLMRRAVSKKKEKDLMLHKSIFIERGPANGINEETAEKIFAEIEFFANYGFNKCLVSETEIIDADTGRVVTIGELASGKVAVFNTLSTNLDTMQLEARAITDVIANGVKPVYTLTTRTGRQITATANHPFYTIDGWKMLGELGTGDLIAAPRVIPVEGKNTWPDYQLITLGHLIAEGNLCHTTGVYFYTARDDQRDDYVAHMEQFSNSVASVAQHKSCHSIYSKRVKRNAPQGLVEWIRELGLWGKGAHEKFIPSDVFTLTNRCVALLLARMWEDDGHINPQHASAHYTTVSKTLVRQMQHLLLRFGIVSRIYHKVYPYQNGEREGWELHVIGRDMMTLFAEHLGCHFIHGAKIQVLALMIDNLPTQDAVRDIVPFAIKERIQFHRQQSGLTWKQLAEKADVAERLFYNTQHDVNKNGITRRTLSKIAVALESEELKRYAESDIYWDQIVSIVPAGEAETYDLTIEGTHNFIANDLLVHNSHAADYAVLTMQTAFLKTHYPEEYMTALLCVQFDNSDKVAIFLDECRRLQIPILPPDVNYSQFDFDIQVLDGGKRAIRFGLGAIKHVGGGVVDVIINCRNEHGEFQSLEHFCQVLELKDVGKRPMESLIKVGAFDSFGYARDALLESLDRIMGFSAQFHKEKNTRARSLFGDDAALRLDIPPAKNPIKNREQFTWERELMGLYVSGNPLDQHRETFAAMNLMPIQELKDTGSDGQPVRIGGEVMSVRKMPTKSGDMMAVFMMADWHPTGGSIEVVLFPRTYKKAIDQLAGWETPRDLVEGEVFAVNGTLDTKRGSPQIIADSIQLGGETVRRRDPNAGYTPLPPPEFVSTGFDDDMPIYDDEAGGEVVAQDRVVYVTAQGSQDGSGSQNGNGHHNGNGNGHHPSEANIFADLFGAAEQKPIRHIRVYFPRKGQLESDTFLLKKLHSEFIGKFGEDTFSIVVPDDKGRDNILEFPQTTGYSHELLNALAVWVGEDNIVVR